MTIPRLGIGEMMVVVGVIAIDLAAVRAVLGSGDLNGWFGEWLRARPVAIAAGSRSSAWFAVAAG